MCFQAQVPCNSLDQGCQLGVRLGLFECLREQADIVFLGFLFNLLTQGLKV